MQRITLLSGLDGFTGYGLHLIEVVRHLEKRNVHPSIRAIKTGVAVPSDVRAYVVNGRQPEEWELLLAPPHHAPTPGKKTAYFTMCESTVLPRASVALVNKATVVIVPSQWCATVFSANGVTAPIRVVPLGINPKVFALQPPTEDVVFGAAGCLNHGFHRKGLQRVIDLFQKAFPVGQEEVRLRVKCQKGDPVLVGVDPRIEILNKFLPETELANWYRSLTAFVNIATGGWEMMPHQAMAVGRPNIGPCYGGMADYHNEFTGFVVPHRFSPARDAWTNLGVWADVDDQAMIEAMRLIHRDPEQAHRKGIVASHAASLLSWENSNDKLFDVLTEFGALHRPARNVVSLRDEPEQPSTDERLTVAITSFRRSKHLDRAIKSAAEVAEFVVVASMMPDDETKRVLEHWKAVLGIRMTVAVINADLGCNELWLQAAYHTQTDRLIILHDDDFLDPKLKDVYRDTICPALKDDVGFASWRGHVVWDNGDKREIEYWHGETRTLPSSELAAFVGTKGRLSLSPVVSVFRRPTLIQALKESAQWLTEPLSWLHPGMLLGTEIVAYLRHCAAFQKWLYVNEVLSYYGAWEGSGTVRAEQAKNLEPLVVGYDIARDIFAQNPKTTPEGRILLVYSDMDARGDEERLRFEQAILTWDYHCQHGTMLAFPVSIEDINRCALDIGDKADVPYVRDLFEFGVKFARPEDLIVLINRDVCLTSIAPERLWRGVQESSGIVACQRRNMPAIETGRIYRSVRNCIPDGGFDVFAVTPRWWKRYGRRLPDMFLGREAWDTVYRRIAEEQAGEKAYVDDVCYHTAHFSEWQKDRRGTPSQKHNRKLALEFFQRRNDRYLIDLLK